MANLVKLNTDLGTAYIAVINISFILEDVDQVKIGLTCGQVFTTTSHTIEDVISVIFGSKVNVELEKAPTLS